MKIAWPIYRRLAAAFPHEFKLAFGDEMLHAGEDAIGEVAKRHGALGLFRLIADLAFACPSNTSRNAPRPDVRPAPSPSRRAMHWSESSPWASASA